MIDPLNTATICELQQAAERLVQAAAPDVARALHRIVRQELKPEGVLTTWQDGRVAMLPYQVDADGSEYVDLDPNREIWPEEVSDG